MALKEGTKARLYKGTGTDLAIAVFALKDLVADRISIGEFAPTREKIDVTRMGDTAKKYAVSGVVDNGEITIEMGIANYAIFSGLQQSGEELPFAVAHPDATEINMAFMGVVTGCTRNALEMTGEVTMSVTIQINGDIDDAFEEPTV